MRVLLQHSVSLQEPRSQLTSTKARRLCQVRLEEGQGGVAVYRFFMFGLVAGLVAGRRGSRPKEILCHFGKKGLNKN